MAFPTWLSRPAKPAAAVLSLAGMLGTASADAQIATTLPGIFNWPNAIVADRHGNLFVADSFDSVVKEIPAVSGSISPIVLGVPAAPAEGVALDGSGNLFVTDPIDNTVGEISASGAYQVIGSGFLEPRGIAIDPGGNLFIADTGNGAIKEILAAGGYTTVQTIATGLSRPIAIALDTQGDLFVAVQDGAVEIAASAGGYGAAQQIITGVVAPSGIAVNYLGTIYLSNGQVAAYSQQENYSTPHSLVPSFSQSAGLAVDNYGNLFVADIGGRTVYRLDFDGNLTYPNPLGGGGLNGPLNVAARSIDLYSSVAFATDSHSNAVYNLTAEGEVPTAPARFYRPQDIAVDGAGNVFVTDAFQKTISEIPAAGGYGTVVSIGPSFTQLGGIAADAAGDVFVADSGTGALEELQPGDGYSTVKTIITFSAIGGRYPFAVDAAGNIFMGTGTSITELLAATGYSTSQTLGKGLGNFRLIAIDQNENLFVSDGGANSLVQEIPAAGGYTTIRTLAGGFNEPTSIAVDPDGNVYVTESISNPIKKIVMAGSPLSASVLPGGRSTLLGTPATIYASLVNSGAAALDNCRIALPSWAPAGLTFDYQTTDPATNRPTGTPDMPVSIAGQGGVQSFVLTFQGSAALSVTGMPLVYSCDGAAPATIFPDLNTVDLAMAGSATADFVALAATPSNDGVLHVPITDAGAFAVATTNLGAQIPITAMVDTGAATLPLGVTICQTDPASGTCLQTAAKTVAVSYDGGPAPTFSIFVQTSGAIPLTPATSRVFVRFVDNEGGLHGSTSVAVQAF